MSAVHSRWVQEGPPTAFDITEETQPIQIHPLGNGPKLG